MRRLLAGAALAGAPAWLLAQDDAVVVTATRAPRPALEIPASVDRIYGDEIREGRPQVNLSESLGRVPGITVQNRQNYAQDLQIQSRGFGARSTFGVRGIRLVADGIPATMPDGQGQASTFALGSAERVEVLRGPFSALYGNASGGVIAMQTREGPETPTAETDLLYGSYQTWRGALRFGGRFDATNATGELSRFQTNGYRDHSWARRDQTNAKMKYAFDDATTLTLVGNTLGQPETQDPLGLTKAEKDQNPRQATPNALLFNTRKSVSQEQGGGTLSRRLGEGRVEAMLYAGQRSVQQFLAIPLGTQGAATHSGGVVDLDRDYEGGALRYFHALSSVRLSLGVERDSMYERRKGYINNFGVIGGLKRDEQNTVSSTDWYAQAEWKVAESWALHGGLRRSRVHFNSTDHYFATNGDDSGSRTYQATTPVAGIVWRAAETTSLYANYGRGFETPTFLELAYRNGASGLNFDLEASRSRHGEAGAKSILPGWARITAAGFDIRTSNEIVVDQNSGGRATFKNVGHTRRRGFELGAETLLAGSWQARAAWTRLKAEFEEGFDTVIGVFPNNTPVSVPAGASLPGTARNQLYGELRYRAEPVFAALEALYRSRVAVNDPNTEFADPFTVLSAVAGLSQKGGRWKLTEFVRCENLTNRDYVGSVIVNETNFRYYEPAPRRSWFAGVQASLQF